MRSRTQKPVPPLEDVKHQIRAITKSPAFSHSTRQTKLLEYLCNKVLLGEAEQIKAATIAMEVFGRPWDFDETKDAVVRVEAHRLRRKLAKYYDEHGAYDRIRVVLMPGGYVPEFVYYDAPAALPAAKLETPRGGGPQQLISPPLPPNGGATANLHAPSGVARDPPTSPAPR